MIAAALLQLVLLPVDDDGGDLLVHEEQDGGEDRGDTGQHRGVDGVSIERGDEPATSAQCRGEAVGHRQLGGGHAYHHVGAGH